MKKIMAMLLTLVMAMGLLAGCGANGTTSSANPDTPSAESTENFSDEMKIPYTVDLSPEDGADSVERAGDHPDSPYFAHPDVYNMESTDTLMCMSEGHNLLVGEPLEVMNSKLVEEVYLGVEEDE